MPRKIEMELRSSIMIRESDGSLKKYVPAPKPESKKREPNKNRPKPKPKKKVTGSTSHLEIDLMPKCRVLLHNMTKEEIALAIQTVEQEAATKRATISDADIAKSYGNINDVITLFERIKIGSYESKMLSIELNNFFSITPRNTLDENLAYIGFARDFGIISKVNMHQIVPNSISFDPLDGSNILNDIVTKLSRGFTYKVEISPNFLLGLDDKDVKTDWTMREVIKNSNAVALTIPIPQNVETSLVIDSMFLLRQMILATSNAFNVEMILKTNVSGLRELHVKLSWIEASCNDIVEEESSVSDDSDVLDDSNESEESEEVNT